MYPTPVIAVLDVGKTNKKLFLFDSYYHILWQESSVLEETTDEDGDACEDIYALNAWMVGSLGRAFAEKNFQIIAINFSAYGASLVHIGNEKIVTPLYNYLKAYPEKLRKVFYDTYGGEMTFSMISASPVLGSLNSGMQIYRIKKENPELLTQIRFSLHLPQYLSWFLTGEATSDMTSIGCHTNLWNFSQNSYHEWVYREEIIHALAPIQSSRIVYPIRPGNSHLPFFEGMANKPVAGTGLHDSSAAMIPYLESFQEPFVLISTGTWCISMNAFNQEPLTSSELHNDCLCYMSYNGKPIKASRLFAGYEHELQTERLAVYFQLSRDFYKTVTYDPEMVSGLKSRDLLGESGQVTKTLTCTFFVQRNLSDYKTYEEAYHQLMMDIMDQQLMSTKMIMPENSVTRIFVDGGFSKNPLYMHLLASAFPGMEVFAASIPQASAIGAAMAIHPHWNERPLPSDIIELKYYKQ